MLINQTLQAKLKILYTNIDSLTNKKNELETYISVYNADIILIVETLSKNSNNVFDNIFHIDGFNCIEENTGRGICIFYKEDLEIVKHQNISEMFKPSLFINIKQSASSKPLNLGLIYRSPNSDKKENKRLNNQLNFATKKLKNLILFGDFNHPHIDWEYFSCNKHEEHADSLFLYEIIKVNTNQLICKTTHHKPLCKPTLLDLIITKSPELISNIKHNPPIGKSHHDVITSEVNADFTVHDKKPKNNIKISKPNFEKADFKAINQFLDNVEWNDLFKDKSVNEAWNILSNFIKQAQELYVPNKLIKQNKTKQNHISKDDSLHFLLKQKRFYFKLYKKYKSKTNLYRYNHARNMVSFKIKSLKKSKEHKIAKNIKNDPKAFYQYIASKLLKKESISDLIDKNGCSTKSDTDKCEVLNDFFSSVFTKEDDDNIPNFVYDGEIPNSLSDCNVSINDFEKALSNLKPNKSPGPDNFHPKFFKLCSKSLALPLKLLFDLTLLEGALPMEWKTAEVRPIYKKR